MHGTQCNNKCHLFQARTSTCSYARVSFTLARTVSFVE